MEQHVDVKVTSVPREGNPVTRKDPKVITRVTVVAEEGMSIQVKKKLL